MRRQISQREALRLRRRVADFEELQRKQSAAWVREWPGGVVLEELGGKGYMITDVDLAIVETARKLGHAVVVTISSGSLYLSALPVASSGEKP